MLGLGLSSVLALCGVAVAQDLGVPLSWREFGTDRPHDERVQISQNAINEILARLNVDTGEFDGIGFWQSGNVWSVAALQDWVAGTTVNRDAVVNNLHLVAGLYDHYDRWGYNDDALWWAQGALYAYRAYQDSSLLDHAITTWNFVSAYQLTQDQVNSGSTPVKGGPILGSCDGNLNAGGVFWRPASDVYAVNSVTTGLFLTLSASLYEITSDTKYLDAATAAATWIRDANTNEAGLPLDTINVNDCSKNEWIFTYNSGKMIEGLSILVDRTGDAGWGDLLVNLAAASMKNSPWQGEDGIITEGASPNENNDGVGFKAVLIRALHECFLRSENNDLRILIHSYIDVQFNALLDLAATGNTYSSSWTGPPQDYTSWGQLAALDPLMAAILTND